MTTAPDLQERVTAFVRAFGLHHPERTACGQPLTTSEAHALAVLDAQPGLRLTDLAAELWLDKSTVSRLVASLAERGWVRVTADPRDGRARLNRLTPAGRRAARRLAEARRGHFERLLRAIEPERRVDVLAALDVLTAASRRAGRGSHAASA